MAEISKTQNSKENSGGLTFMILIAIVVGILFALGFPQQAVKVQLGGEIFLRLLKMMVVPLVVTSVMSGILGMGDIRKLGRPGAAAIGYYLSTTVLAVIVGLVIVNLIRPGAWRSMREILPSLRRSWVTSRPRLRFADV